MGGYSTLARHNDQVKPYGPPDCTQINANATAARIQSDNFASLNSQKSFSIMETLHFKV